jgi:drug/metabolite transporter (DMT)-like permease
MTHSPTHDKNLHPYLGVGMGVTICSTAAILIRLAQAEAHSLVIAAWRLTLATLILTPLVLATRWDELRRLSRGEWISALASGALLAIHFGSWITSLAYTSVAASVVLVTTYPIFVGLTSRLLLRERLSPGIITAIVVAITGSVLIGVGDLGKGTHHLWGDVLALMGAISGAGYFLIGHRLRSRLSLLAYVYPVYGTAALFLMAVMLASGLPKVPRQPQTWLWLLLMALGPQILGHSSLNWSLRYLSTTYVTIATLGDPIGSSLLAWLLLGERPSPWTIVGGTLILAGIAVASRVERSADTTAPCPPGSSGLQLEHGNEQE